MKERFIPYFKTFIVILIVIALYGAVIILVLKHDPLDEAVRASLVGAGIALVTGILALLKDFVMNIINAPILRIKFFPNDKRDCHVTKFTQKGSNGKIASTNVFYFRVRVGNYGWSTAEDVEVSLEEVKKFQNSRFEINQDFMPLRLGWSHWKLQRLELAIPPGTYRHCDFGFILDPNAEKPPLPPKENDSLLFWLDVLVRPNAGRTSLLPGKYQITISAFGKNAQKTSHVLEIEWKGGWEADIDVLLSKRIAFG